jgi:hypothetical protein
MIALCSAIFNWLLRNISQITCLIAWRHFEGPLKLFLNEASLRTTSSWYIKFLVSFINARCSPQVASFFWTNNALKKPWRNSSARLSWKRQSKSSCCTGQLALKFLCSACRPPPMNVLPLVNKGLALYQWKQDIGAAERCCNEALRIDPECEAAVATLAQLSLQQSKIERAVEMFARQAELARSEAELVNALTYQYVCLVFFQQIPAADLVRCELGIILAIGFSQKLSRTS